LAPTPDSGDDFVRAGHPGEGLWVIVGLAQEAVDGGLKIDNRSKHGAFEAALAGFAKKPSTALSNEHEVGV
jgi:hypothetical protein